MDAWFVSDTNQHYNLKTKYCYCAIISIYLANRCCSIRVALPRSTSTLFPSSLTIQPGRHCCRCRMSSSMSLSPSLLINSWSMSVSIRGRNWDSGHTKTPERQRGRRWGLFNRNFGGTKTPERQRRRGPDAFTMVAISQTSLKCTLVLSSSIRTQLNISIPTQLNISIPTKTNEITFQTTSKLTQQDICQMIHNTHKIVLSIPSSR